MQYLDSTGCYLPGYVLILHAYYFTLHHYRQYRTSTVYVLKYVVLE